VLSTLAMTGTTTNHPHGPSIILFVCALFIANCYKQVNGMLKSSDSNQYENYLNPKDVPVNVSIIHRDFLILIQSSVLYVRCSPQDESGESAMNACLLSYIILVRW